MFHQYDDTVFINGRLCVLIKVQAIMKDVFIIIRVLCIKLMPDVLMFLFSAIR